MNVDVFMTGGPEIPLLLWLFVIWCRCRLQEMAATKAAATATAAATAATKAAKAAATAATKAAAP